MFDTDNLNILSVFILKIFNMKKISFTLSNKLYNKLNEIREFLSKKENNEINLDEIIEEAIMEYYNIKLTDINEDIEYDNNIINIINDIHNDDNYYIYVYYNNRKKMNLNVTDYVFTSEPIYIGKGQNNRLLDLNNRDNNLIELINDLKMTNDFSSQKIIENLSEDTAYYYEQMFINSIGRLNNGSGPLYNKRGGTIKKNNEKLNSNNCDLNIEYDLIKLIVSTLNKTNNISKTAKKLNISERTLYRKLDKYSIKKNDNEWIVLK